MTWLSPLEIRKQYTGACRPLKPSSFGCQKSSGFRYRSVLLKRRSGSCQLVQEFFLCLAWTLEIAMYDIRVNDSNFDSRHRFRYIELWWRLGSGKVSEVHVYL